MSFQRSAGCSAVLSNDDADAMRASARIDARARPERAHIGAPDLGEFGEAPHCEERRVFPSKRAAAGSMAGLAAALSARDGAQTTPAIFLGRSRARSRAAIALRRRRCFNVAAGIEEGLEETRRRGALGGRRAKRPPSTQP
jgi:hypothetical protein